MQIEGGRVALHRNAFTRHLSHTQVGERFWVVGLEEKPVARDHNPRSEEGASPKSVMTRPLKSLRLASSLSICHRWTVKMDEGRQEQLEGRIQEDEAPFDVKETVKAIPG